MVEPAPIVLRPAPITRTDPHYQDKTSTGYHLRGVEKIPRGCFQVHQRHLGDFSCENWFSLSAYTHAASRISCWWWLSRISLFFLYDKDSRRRDLGEIQGLEDWNCHCFVKLGLQAELKPVTVPNPSLPTLSLPITNHIEVWWWDYHRLKPFLAAGFCHGLSWTPSGKECTHRLGTLLASYPVHGQGVEFINSWVVWQQKSKEIWKEKWGCWWLS